MKYEGQFNSINFTNVQIIGNSLTITQSTYGIAAIFIQSPYAQNIIFKGCSFIDNHLHNLVDDLIQYSTPTITLDTISSNVTITDTQFKQNRATKSKYPVLVLKNNIIKLSRTTFSESNIVQQSWYDRLEESTLLNQNDTITMLNIKNYFQILSHGGNALLQAQNIDISDSSFSDGHAILGTGLFITLVGEGQLRINNTSFQNQINNLDPQYLSAGGCLYIDSSSSKLNFYMLNVSMANCVARLQGGCIYVVPSTTESIVKIMNSTFMGCQGLQSSFMSAEFTELSIVEPDVQMTNVVVQDNDMVNFLHNVPNLSDNELSLFRSMGTAYKQVYGKLSLSTVVFSKLQCVSALYIKLMIQVLLYDVSVSFNIILLNPLVYVDLLRPYGSLILSASQFTGNVEFKVETNSTDHSKCDNYIQTYTKYIVAPQECVAQAAAQILFKKIQALAEDLASLNIYNEAVNRQYTSLVDEQKYSFPIIYSDQIVNQDIPYPYTTGAKFKQLLTLTSDEMRSFSPCYISYIYAYTDTLLTLKNYTALMFIQAVNSTNQVKVSTVGFEHNKCLGCAGGLLQIMNVQNYRTKNIQLLDINCQSNVIGYYGCISVTSQNSFQYATLQLPITDYPVSNRLLSLEDDLIAQNYTLIIQNSQFNKNNAKVGSGLSIIGINVLVINCMFTDNYAVHMGGAVYFNNSASEQALTQFGNTFQNNVAQIAGAIFMSGSWIDNTDIMQIHFNSNNGTIRGNNIEEKPSRLTIFMQEGKYMETKTYMNHSGDLDNDGYVDDTNVPIIDIIDLPLSSMPNHDGLTNYLILPSGQTVKQYFYYYNYTEELVPYEWIFRIINLDRYNQPMSNIDRNTQCRVTGRIMDINNYDDTKEFLSNFTTISNYQFDSNLGAFDLDLLTVLFDPYLESNLFLQLKFVCDSISIPVYRNSTPFDIIGYNTNYALLVNIHTFQCQLGEAYNSQICKSCAKNNTYSIILKQSQCAQLDISIMEQVSPTAIKLKPGYWRVDMESENIVSCSNQIANCNGGWKPGDSSCYTGHIGGQCESCDLYSTRSEDSYTTSTQFNCGLCADTIAHNSLIITAISIFTLGSITMSVISNYQSIKDYVKNRRLREMGINIPNNARNLSVLIKQLINYFQIISALTTFKLGFSSSLTSTFDVVGNPIQSIKYSLDCFLITITNIEILYFRLIWSQVMIIVYITILLLGYFIGVLCKKLPYKVSIIYTTFHCIFYYFWPAILWGCAIISATRNLGGIEYISADVAYRLDSPTFKLKSWAYAMPIMILWVFIIPAIYFLIFCFKIRHNLNDLNNRKIFGYFYNEYHNRAYYWESIKLMQKYGIITVIVFYEDRVQLKGLIIVVLQFYYFFFSFSERPYTAKWLNQVDLASTAMSGISIFFGVLLSIATITEGDKYLTWLLYFNLCVQNIAFLVYLVYYLLDGFWIKYRKPLDELREKIYNCIPKPVKKYPCLRKLLLNQTKMALRVQGLWELLRYSIRQEIKQSRIHRAAQLLVTNRRTNAPKTDVPRKNVQQYNRKLPALSQNSGKNTRAQHSDTKIYPQTHFRQDSPPHTP